MQTHCQDQNERKQDDLLYIHNYLTFSPSSMRKSLTGVNIYMPQMDENMMIMWMLCHNSVTFG